MLHEAHISSLLKKSSLIRGDIHFSSVNDGMSGALVLVCNDQYVVKYVHSSMVDNVTMSQCRNEYDFYEKNAGRLDFLPEVIFQTADDDELLLVLKKYETIPLERWDSALQQQAMDIYARINSLDCDAYSKTSLWAETETEPGRYPLIESYNNWVKLYDKFPAHLDELVLKDMYDNFYPIAEYADGLPISNTFCHGDLAQPNFLLDGAKLLVCDWQYTLFGKGISAVAFFCLRGVDVGLKIDKDALIYRYSQKLREHTGITVTPEILTRYATASEWLVAFRYAAEHMQEHSIERVAKSYEDMVEKYTTIKNYIK